MLRKIARPMLASIFVVDGADMLRNTNDHVAETESVLNRARKVVPKQYQSYVPNDPELVARTLGGAKVGAGSLLALGKAPRTSAAVLAASTLPTLLGRDAFWEADTKEEKAQRRNGFLTNTALLGALFITTQDTEGKPSLRWRTQKAAATTNKKIQKALPTKSESQKFTDDVAGRANEWFGETSEKVQAYVDDAKHYVDENKGDWEKAGKGLLATAMSYVDDAKHYVDENKGEWEKTGKGLLDSAKGYANEAKGYVGNNKQAWLKAAQDNAAIARKSAVKSAAKAQERADQALAKAQNVDTKRAAKNAEKLQVQADKAIANAIHKVGQNLR